MSGSSERGSTPFERYVQHAVQVVTVSSVIGGTVAFFDLRTQNAVLEQRLISIEDRIDEIKQGAGDRYTGTEARRDFVRIETLLNDHEKRIRALESFQSPR